MEKINSWWLAKIRLENEEQPLWSCLANRVQSRWRAVGGKLILTKKRVLFVPHLLDAVLFGKKLSIPFTDIISVEKEDIGKDVFAGGLRKRLKILLSDDKYELFVVNDLSEVVVQLSILISNNNGVTRATTMQLEA